MSADVVEALRAKFDTLLPHLDERQQRLLLGAEARSLGHGGIAAVASASGASRSRISQGASELEAGPEPMGRARKVGGGRKSLTETDPELVPGLLALVEPTRRGDPESALAWTTLSTRKLAAELTMAGHRIGPDTVARLLREQGFSLQANSKTLEGSNHPDRDEQFSYLNEHAQQHLAAGDPVVSVDMKKKELVGEYKNGGREWRPAGDPEKVKVHDFKDPELGKANPYGVYDVAANTGWVGIRTVNDAEPRRHAQRECRSTTGLRRTRCRPPWSVTAGWLNSPHLDRRTDSAASGPSAIPPRCRARRGGSSRWAVRTFESRS